MAKHTHIHAAWKLQNHGDNKNVGVKYKEISTLGNLRHERA